MEQNKTPQIGLVLTGGGAKGAYQAGTLQYIAEIGLKPQIIAGTSIGALNGATFLKQRGYKDAKRCLEPILDTLITVRQQRQAHNELVKLLVLNPCLFKTMEYFT